MVSFVLAGAALVSFAPPANAVNYTTSGFSLTSLGDDDHSGYDWLTGTSETGTLSDPSTILLNTLSFTAGVNANRPPILSQHLCDHGDDDRRAAGTPQQIHDTVYPQYQLPGYPDCHWRDPRFQFLDGSTLWQGAVNGVTLGPNAGGTQTGHSLTGNG